MEITKLLKNDENRAVSPVIGVILMVAITVILAAVIGTFVLGLGDQVDSTAPNANFQWDYDSNNDEAKLTHNGGDSLDAATVTIVGDGLGTGGEVTNVSNAGNGAMQSGEAFNDPIRAGQSVTVNTTTSGGGEVRVVWTAPDGSSSSTMATMSVPE